MTMGVWEEFFSYARQEGALSFVHYAVAAADNVQRRADEARLFITRARHTHSDLEKSVRTGAEPSTLVSQAKPFHYAVLGAIEKLAVLAETFFTSLSVIKRDYRKLPFAVLKEINPWPEVSWAKRAPLRELKRLMLFPRPSMIFADSGDREIARKALLSAARELAATLRRTALFYGRFAPIYNKYKHTVSEHAGYVEPVNVNGVKTIQTTLFFEDYPRARARKPRGGRRRRPSTWGVVAGVPLLDYLERIASDLVALHKVLLLTRLEYLHNKRAPFFPSVGDFLPDNLLQDLRRAFQREHRFRTIQEISLKTRVQWAPKAKAKVRKQAESKNGVFKLSGHIFRGKKAVAGAKVEPQGT